MKMEALKQELKMLEEMIENSGKMTEIKMKNGVVMIHGSPRVGKSVHGRIMMLKHDINIYEKYVNEPDRIKEYLKLCF
jgi:GTP1/Obg family GTP-binding protein